MRYNISNTNNETLSILVTGDLCPINRIEEYCKKNEQNLLFRGFESELNEKDISITNLECPLTNNAQKINKIGPALSAQLGAVKSLVAGNFDVVTLSNNHILDFGQAGLQSTLEVLQKNNIRYVGAGCNKKEARKPLNINIKNKRICILNYSENEFSTARINRAGSNPLDLINIVNDVKKARDNSEIIIAIIHGGIEGYEYPTPNQRKLFRFVASLGVTAVIGHHTHCPSGFEIIDNVPIFYSLGNFIFDFQNNKSQRIKEGYGVRLNISIKDNIVSNFELIPYYQCKNKVGLEIIPDTEKKAFLNRINNISDNITNDDIFYKKWQLFLKEQNFWRLNMLLMPNKFFRNLFSIKLIQSVLMKFYNYNSIYGIVNCESHREILIENLKRKIDE